jgi:hypothetical protein
MSGREICTKYESAVVRLYSQWLFTDAITPSDVVQPPTALPPLVPGALLPLAPLYALNMYGNGFFITKHIIVCPAHLVLAPPNYTLAYNQWPFIDDSISSGSYQNVMSGPNRINVDVIDVNGSGHSYTYAATLLGVSGIGDIAVLYINPADPWNRNVPCIKECHPHFKFGCSRKYKCGEKVFALGDPFTRPLPYNNNWCTPLNKTRGHAFVQGTIADNRYLDYAGYAQPELVAVNMPIFDRRAGLPLIDKFGHVIGMQTMSVTGAVTASDNTTTALPLTLNPTLYVPPNGDGVVAGPSQFFMLHVVKTLLCPNKDCNVSFVETVSGPGGLYSFYRYIYGFLGLAWEVFTGAMYQSYRDQNGYDTPFFNVSPNSYLNTNAIKEVIGLRVVGVAKDDPTTPATSPDQANLYLPNMDLTSLQAPLEDVVMRNDIITHADGLPLGDLSKQIPISLLLFRKAPGDNVTLVVRTSSIPNPATLLPPFSNNVTLTGYDSVVNKTVQTTTPDLFWDYPWYAYYKFPWIKGNLFTPFFDATFPYILGIAPVPFVLPPTVIGIDNYPVNIKILTTPVV